MEFQIHKEWQLKYWDQSHRVFCIGDKKLTVIMPLTRILKLMNYIDSAFHGVEVTLHLVDVRLDCKRAASGQWYARCRTINQLTTGILYCSKFYNTIFLPFFLKEKSGSYYCAKVALLNFQTNSRQAGG